MADNFFKVNRGLTLNPQSSIPTNPVNGDCYYDASQGTFVLYDNGFWINLSSQADVSSASSLNSAQLTAAVVQNSLVRITGSTPSNLYGLMASTAAKQIILYNASTSDVTIYNNNAGEPTAANRISTVNGANVVVNSGQIATFIYDGSQMLWIAASGSGSGSSGGQAGEVALSSGSTSVNVTFGSPQSSTIYAVIAQMLNSVDVNPEFQPITITDKTTTGFIATWNAPLDTSNYLLDYIVSGAQDQFGEAILSSGTTSATVTLPIPISGSYVVIAELTNYTDPSPQFQPITVQAKGLSTFTVGWNAALDTSNYRLEYQIALT